MTAESRTLFDFGSHPSAASEAPAPVVPSTAPWSPLTDGPLRPGERGILLERSPTAAAAVDLARYRRATYPAEPILILPLKGTEEGNRQRNVIRVVAA